MIFLRGAMTLVGFAGYRMFFQRREGVLGWVALLGIPLGLNPVLGLGYWTFLAAFHKLSGNDNRYERAVRQAVYKGKSLIPLYVQGRRVYRAL